MNNLPLFSFLPSMYLDSHDKLALVEVIIYILVNLFCIYINIRQGFRRDAGWIYLTISIRMSYFASSFSQYSLPTLETPESQDCWFNHDDLDRKLEYNHGYDSHDFKYSCTISSTKCIAELLKRWVCLSQQWNWVY